MIQPRLLLVLTAVMLSLPGCLTTQQGAASPPVSTPPLVEIVPARPSPLRLSSEKFSVCGKAICLTAAQAKKLMLNKVATIRYIEQSNALLDYYERRANPDWAKSIPTR